MQSARAAKRAVAADDNKAVDFVLGQDFERLALALFLDEFRAAAGLQKSAGIADASRDDVVVEVHELVVEQPLVTVADADDVEALVEARAGDGPDGRIHAGGIAAGSEDCYALHKK